MATSPCPSCRQPKGPGKYLCPGCWSGLPMTARRALSRRDARAMTRLRELHSHLTNGTPLAEIEVGP
ncbi:hypothetical protein [Streptomyces sp. H27-C3]|uniref:hypothetical protein n=1 Tax=Streptomyces sp. H27-C3 TaxID=3046305 RepID=UPI0024BB8639|nr:hypothetical protein [Streptomyces sp. H27-C3]MDJ0460631.1 hypothetical protein [Streptomyces sp. H27-C3]